MLNLLQKYSDPDIAALQSYLIVKTLTDQLDYFKQMSLIVRDCQFFFKHESAG